MSDTETTDNTETSTATKAKPVRRVRRKKTNAGDKAEAPKKKRSKPKSHAMKPLDSQPKKPSPGQIWISLTENMQARITEVGRKFVAFNPRNSMKPGVFKKIEEEMAKKDFMDHFSCASLGKTNDT